MAQLPLDLGFRPALGRDDFLVAPCNADAVAWIDRWPGWPSPALALWGAAGSGKSHLGEVWRARSGATAIAAPALTTPTVPQNLGDATAVLLDDATHADEEALLHLYNLVAERQGYMLIVAREPPARWGIRLADLRSRLLAIPAVAVEPPDEALLGALLVKLFSDRQIKVAQDVIAYLLVHLDRSFAAAQDAVAVLDRAALVRRRAVTVPLVREALGFNRRQDPD